MIGDLDRTRAGWAVAAPIDCVNVFVNVVDSASYRDLVEQGGSDLRIDLNDLGRSDKT